MAFDWGNYISFAEDLYNNRSDDAALRSSISRAYYGAFCKVKNYCVLKHPRDLREAKGDGVHQKVIQILKGSDNSQEYSLGNALHSLREERNKADYDAHARITKSGVSNVITSSKNILTTLDELDSDEEDKAP